MTRKEIEQMNENEVETWKNNIVSTYSRVGDMIRYLGKLQNALEKDYELLRGKTDEGETTTQNCREAAMIRTAFSNMRETVYDLNANLGIR